MQRWAATTFCRLQETERKREAFYELLAHRYPEYADKITAQYGPVERVSSVCMNMCIVKLAMNAFHVVNMSSPTARHKCEDQSSLSVCL